MIKMIMKKQRQKKNSKKIKNYINPNKNSFFKLLNKNKIVNNQTIQKRIKYKKKKK